MNSNLENWVTNAAFIVQAVNCHDDLKETLEIIANTLELWKDSRFDNLVFEARKAIAKAEGK